MKFSNDLSVCAPQYLSAGTRTSPKASVSALVSAILFVVAWNCLSKRGCWEVWELFRDVASVLECVLESVYIDREAATALPGPNFEAICLELEFLKV